MLQSISFDFSEFIRTDLAKTIAKLDAGENVSMCVILGATRNFRPNAMPVGSFAVDQAVIEAGYIPEWAEKKEWLNGVEVGRPVLFISREPLTHKDRAIYLDKAQAEIDHEEGLAVLDEIV